MELIVSQYLEYQHFYSVLGYIFLSDQGMGLKDRVEANPSRRWDVALNDIAKSTRITYRREFREFLLWADETPESLIEYWIERMADPKRNLAISDAVNDYVSMLDEEVKKNGDPKYTGGKQSAVVKAVKKFFDVNGFKPVFHVRDRAQNEGARTAKIEEIKQVLAHGIRNPRNAAIVAITKDSALRVSDIVRIKIKHIQPIIDDPSLEWLCFKIDVKKTSNKKRKALPCFGADALKYLRLWLTKRAKLGITSDAEDYVFVNIRNVVDYETAKESRNGSEIGRMMRDSSASVAIGELCKRAGISDLSSNSFRKFNTTALTMSGMGENRIKLMQGKHQNSSIDSYLDAEANTMLEVYKEYYNYISINQESEEINTLQEKVSELTDKLEIALIDRDRATLLEARLDKIEKLIREKS